MPEYTAIALFAVLFTVTAIMHEPWFDEAQAWQIAKCAGLKDILFHLPHYEGHPPLWHLLLMLPAKLGFPYELSIKVLSAIPTFFTAWLILFKLDLPLPVRLLLPFNYFIFYQYGVISRPYCFIFPLMLLLAESFADKDRHPWKFTGLLALLCLVSAYGIVIAGGISVAWVWDIISRNIKNNGKSFFMPLIKDRCVAPLICLLLLAVLLILQIMPYSDTLAATRDKNTDISHIIFSFFGMISEAFVTAAVSAVDQLTNVQFTAGQLLPCVILGILMLGVILLTAPRKQLKYFFIPYTFFCAFSVFVYLSSHHIGILASLVLFEYVICRRSPEPDSEDTLRESDADKVLIGSSKDATADLTISVSAKPAQAAEDTAGSIGSFIWDKLSSKDRNTLKTGLKCLAAACLLVPAVWTGAAAATDIANPYFFSRDTASFLKETGLCDAKIFSPLSLELTTLTDEQKAGIETESAASGDTVYADGYRLLDTNVPANAVSVCAYFDRNIVYNLNGGDDALAYITHIAPSYEENLKTLEEWKSLGYPDVLLGKCDLEDLYGPEADIPDYSAVYCMRARGASIWKLFYYGDKDSNFDYIYVRDDLLEKYGLTRIETVDD